MKTWSKLKIGLEQNKTILFLVKVYYKFMFSELKRLKNLFIYTNILQIKKIVWKFEVICSKINTYWWIRGMGVFAVLIGYNYNVVANGHSKTLT